MKKLIRHELDSNQAISYFLENLENTNNLSSFLLKKIKFNKGRFFTLLPNNANLFNKYNFKEGGILPYQPKKEYVCKGEKAFYSEIPNIRTEVSNFINKTIKEHSYNCVVDDVIRYATDKKLPDIFFELGFTRGNEIYYVIQRDSTCPENIMSCLNLSNAFWHSLCILTSAHFDDTLGRTLNDEKLNEICERTQMVILGAYDSEGYLFWEKT